MEQTEPSGRSIAVIGSGVAGLTAAYVLSARDRVTLFEADTRIGGHAHTHYLDRGDGYIVGVDSAFLVHNDRTYPTLCRLFDELGVATQETDMSMSVRDDDSGLEYAGARGIGGLFPSWSTLTRGRYLPMLTEVKRFHRAATRLLRNESADEDETLASFLDRHGFSQYFIDYLHDAAGRRGVVVSAGRRAALSGPLSLRLPRPPRHAVGVRLADLAHRHRRIGHLRRGDRDATRRGDRRPPVRSVRRVPEGVLVAVGSGRPHLFDAAVIATHPDQALLMLAEPTAAERMVLGAIPYCANEAQLHTDESVLPRNRRARASWNYLVAPDRDNVLVTYDVTRLMRLTGPRRFLVTLGGHDHVDPSTVLAEMTYDHPLYTPESVAAQRRLPTLDDDRVVFAGPTTAGDSTRTARPRD